MKELVLASRSERPTSFSTVEAPSQNSLYIPTPSLSSHKSLDSSPMVARLFFLLVVVCCCLVGALGSSAGAGDADPIYRTCVEECQGDIGSSGDGPARHCQFAVNSTSVNANWKQWNCRGECHYKCMMQREKEREALGLDPVKYLGRWPFKRVYFVQEPVSAILSAVNLIVQLTGWISFTVLLHRKLPRRPLSKRAYYEFAALWHVYGFLSVNAWFWSVVAHCRGFELDQRLDFSSGIALHGVSLILAIMRTLNVKDEPSRVMISAPFLAFLTTHILYLNFYELDYGLNMIVCTIMGVAQILIWAVWAAATRHPSRLKLWIVVLGGASALLPQTYDFPPYKGYIDARALMYGISIPLSYLWWSFIKADAEIRTATLIKKAS